MSDLTTLLFQDASDSLSRYESSTESYEEQWQKGHVQAMKCLKFEELLAFGLSIFNLINRLDEAWRSKVHNNLLEYDPKVNDAITKLYRSWLHPHAKLDRRLKAFEKAGFEVLGAEEFRIACREVAGVLTPDEDFFASAALVDLRDQAIDAHRRGDSVELERIDD